MVSPTTRYLPSGEMSPGSFCVIAVENESAECRLTASRALVASLAEGAALDHSQNALKVVNTGPRVRLGCWFLRHST